MRVVITPAVMIALSLYGVLASHSFVAAVFWAAGAGGGAWLGIRFSRRGTVVYSAATKSFLVPGSWIPLALMMAIFLVKFVTAGAQARHFALAGAPGFIGTTSLCYGLFSGLFFARAFQILGSAKHADSSPIPARH